VRVFVVGLCLWLEQTRAAPRKTTGCGSRFFARQFLERSAYLLAEGAGDAFGEFDLVFGAGLFGVLFEG
jgi:hypothetical protein